MNSRQNILHRITGALRDRVNKPFPQLVELPVDFSGEQDDLRDRFSNEFIAQRGELILCNGKRALHDNLLSLITSKKWRNISCWDNALLKEFQLTSLPGINRENPDEIEVGITSCECLVARTGSILLSSRQNFGRSSSMSAPVHLVIATTTQLVPDINDAIKLIQRKYEEQLPSAVFLASGPSRTGDIERTLVIGVHGPVEVYILLLNDE